MCYKSPGPRCHAHAKPDYEKALTAYTSAINTTGDPQGEAAKKLRQARLDLDATRTGQATLRNQEKQLREEGKADEADALARRAEEGAAHWRERIQAFNTAEGRDDTFTKSYENSEEQIQAFQEELAARRLQLAEDGNYEEYLNTISRFHSYSPQNQELIHIQNPDATHVAGFKKWQEMGRTVRKGEKGIKILAPSSKQFERKDKNGNPLKDDDGNPIKFKRTFFRAVSVFDIAQTDGKPLAQLDLMRLSETPPAGFREDLETAITSEGFTVSERPLQGGKQGYTSPAGHVVIDSRLTPAEKTATLAHELGHIKAGHLDRLGEYHQGSGGCRGEMEVEAESIAYILCRSNGMTKQLSTSSAAYVHGWAKANPKHIENSTHLISKTVKSILGEHKWSNLFG